MHVRPLLNLLSIQYYFTSSKTHSKASHGTKFTSCVAAASVASFPSQHYPFMKNLTVQNKNNLLVLGQASMVGDGVQWPLFSLKTVTWWRQGALAHCYATVYNRCFPDIEAMHDAYVSIIIAPLHPRSIRLSLLTPSSGTFMNNAIIVEKCKQHCLCSLLCYMNFLQSSYFRAHPFCAVLLHYRVVLEDIWFIPVTAFLKNQWSLSVLYTKSWHVAVCCYFCSMSKDTVQSIHTTSFFVSILR